MRFVDTSAWYALFVPTDFQHIPASKWLAENRGPLLMTDYVIDETLTLMRSRGQPDVALDFGRDAFAGRLATVHYLTRSEIDAAWDVFRTFVDKEWSFTDCTSKVVIEALGIPTAFAFDQHYRQFGSVAVAP